MKLVFISGPLNGQKFKMDTPGTIGRDPSNDIVIPDPAVSLVHCQIYFEGGHPYIKDLGSTNGTILNGARIISSELRDGDGLVIGTAKARVEVPESSIQTGTVNVMPTIRDEEEGDAPPTVVVRPKKRELSGNIFGTVTYFLKRKIADGGMGSVYEAEQFGAEGFIKKVAIKTILPTYVQKSQFVSAFIGEAKLVANLVHQNIVQIHHLGRHEDGYYIAMEYIDGINLTDFMARHKKLRCSAPVDIATFIVSRICRGLEYAHNKKDEHGRPLNLVHRDVSPNNIMITREGEVKLTDFGVAKAAQYMEEDEEYLVGSVEYMSPEQAECRSVDGRSDIFSLGLVYYELLTGVRVFLCKDDGELEATLERVKKADIPDPLSFRPDLPESAVKNLMKCLRRDADDRFQSARELANALEYDMYSKGYGPTIVTLAEYVEKLDEALRLRSKKED
mgnify:FL=1